MQNERALRAARVRVFREAFNLANSEAAGRRRLENLRSDLQEIGARRGVPASETLSRARFLVDQLQSAENDLSELRKSVRKELARVVAERDKSSDLDKV